MKKILRNNGNIILGEDVVKAQKVLQNHANSARAWWADSGYVVIENPEKKDPRWRPLRDLYQEYCTYATEQGYGSLMKSREVSNMLKSQGYSIDKGNMRRVAAGVEVCVGKLGYDTTEVGELILGT